METLVPLLLLHLLGAQRAAAGSRPAVADARGTPVMTEEITVTATGVATRLAETPAAVTVLDAAELAAAPPLVLDDVLRQVPGFTLFRRSGSRTANPTTQGPSLRGVGGSGASRALVLADGVPLNDPFGGWVAWGRVPRLALDRVEVLRGGASDLYGTGALAGVVQLLRRQPAAPAGLLAELSGGEQQTAAGDVWLGVRRSEASGDGDGNPDGLPRSASPAWGLTLAASRLTTAGAVPVAPAERGRVDVAAGGNHTSLELGVERALRGGGRLLARGSSFEEGRGNGTPLQRNDTSLREVVAGADLPSRGGDAALRIWGTRERYFQTFTAIALGRGSETLNRDQRVPSRVLGATARWTGPLGPRHRLLAGLEVRRNRGESDERLFLGPRVVPSSAGGRQRSGGAYVETLLTPSPRWSVAAGLRGDWWQNQSGKNQSGPDPGGERRAQALSPRLSLRWQGSWGFSLAAAAYRSFRAPTLNELYRGFRVGNVITDPNPALGPERLAGAELGAGWMTPLVAGLRLRSTLFWMELEDPIANVTVSSGPDLVRRRRENLGRIRSRGLELEGEVPAGRRLAITGSWLLVESTVESFAADSALVGKRVAQVPRAQASLAATWRGEGVRVTLAGRFSGRAFEDDRNALALDRFAVVDGEVARTLGWGLDAFVAGENLFDEEVVVGRAGVTTVGTPRLLRLGIRYRRGG